MNAAQFRSLLGREPLTPERVIITPLRSLYAQVTDILAVGAPLCMAKGFYQNAWQRTTGGLVVRIPQGIQAQDILWVLPACTVLFIGFAGSPGGMLEVGSVVEAAETLNEEGRVYPLETTGVYPGIRCGCSPCLLGTRAEECCRRALVWDCRAVEMETAALAVAAKKNGQRMTAWLLITDAPGAVGFWEVDRLRRQSLNRAQRELVAMAADWINGGVVSK